MSEYRRDLDETEYMSFLIKDVELLKKYDEIWEKGKNGIKKEFDIEPVWNKSKLKVSKSYIKIL